MAGDRVLAIDGRTLEAPDVLVREVRSGAGSEMLWVGGTGRRPTTDPVTPRVNPPAGQGATGIAFTVVGQTEERAGRTALAGLSHGRLPEPWTWCN